MTNTLAYIVILCALCGIIWAIHASVEQNKKLHLLFCDNKIIMADAGPIRLNGSAAFESLSGKVYIPLPGTTCRVEVVE